MYRVFCESFKNYIHAYSTEDSKSKFRYAITEPISLMVDLDRFEKERESCTVLYKKLCDLLSYMEEQVENYPKFKAFLWTLESRGLKGKKYDMISKEQVKEQAKLINMFLNLLYWDTSN